jgi:oligoendopeptidase F
LNTTQIKRDDLDDKFKWKLTDLLSSPQEWQETYETCINLSNQIIEFKNLLSSNAQTLYECLNIRDKLLIATEKLYVYSHMKLHENTKNPDSQALAQKATALEAKIDQSIAFIEPELISLSKEDFDLFYQKEPKLSTYKHYLNNLIRKKEHILTQAEEELLAKATEFSSSIGDIFSMYNEADLKFPSIKDEKNNSVELTKGRYLSFMESSDRRVRQDAFKAMFSTYEQHKNTLAAIYTSHIKKHIFYKDARKFNSSLEAALFENNIATSVYDQLIKTVHDYLPVMHRYVSLRKKILNVDELHFYDLYTPIIKNTSFNITYDAAKIIVKDSLKILGDEYVHLLDYAFNNRWIDVYENEGKRSGAYSWGTYSTHPYVLLNHTDNLKSMFTLAHEMGHALHSYYSKENQTFINSKYKIFLAEVASTVNESLLMEHLMLTTEDHSMKLYLLNYYMEQFRGTVFRQTMFAEFEKTTHSLMEQGEPLTADNLCKLYLDLNMKYYGTDIYADPLIAMEWARIPHFYYNFYVYQYATGYSAAIALSKRIIKEGFTAIDSYLNFLKSGGSDYPLNLLKQAGVDMTTSQPIASALNVFENLVNEMERTLQ